MALSQDYQLSVMMNHDKDTLPTPETAFVINMENILSVTVTESIITLLPKLEMTLTDNGGFLDLHPIMDKDVIHLTFNNDLGIEGNEVHAAFIISSFKAISDSYGNTSNIFSLVGYLASNNTFAPFSRNAYTGSSDSVIRIISNKMGLKFKNDISGVDNITWHQNSNNYQFLKHVSSRSYIPNDGVFVYTSLNGTMNYTSYNIKNAMPPKFNAVLNRERVQNPVLLPDDALYMYYDSYDILNVTEIYNNISSYGGWYAYYNGIDYITEEIDSYKETTDFVNRDISYDGLPVFSNNVGIVVDKRLQNTIYKGKVQNEYLRYNIFSNTIALNINTSTEVTLFDKVDLNLSSTLGDGIAEPYSGDYVVATITHNLMSQVGYAKRILLCRGGINKNVSNYINPKVM